MACNFKRNLIICPPYDFCSDDCPPEARRSKEFDPHNPPEPRVKPDPRLPLPCLDPCFRCKPDPLRKKPNVPNLKLKQLADCYACRVSDTCHNRRKVFYQRWETHLDRLPRRFPNVDYIKYCCDDYVDLGVNDDFVKYDNYLHFRDGPRTEALKNFLYMKNLAEANLEVKGSMFECPPHEPYTVFLPGVRKDSLGENYDKRHKLYHEDGISLWRELVSRPEYNNFVEGATMHNSYTKPFRRDSSFTNPVDTFTALSSGNDPPYKEIRALKSM